MNNGSRRWPLFKSLHSSRRISNAASWFFLNPAIETFGSRLHTCLYVITSRKFSIAIGVVPGRRKGVFRNNIMVTLSKTFIGGISFRFFFKWPINKCSKLSKLESEDLFLIKPYQCKERFKKDTEVKFTKFKNVLKMTSELTANPTVKLKNLRP